MNTDLEKVLSVCRKTRGNNHETGVHYLLGYLWALMPDEKKEIVMEVFKLEDTNE